MLRSSMGCRAARRSNSFLIISVYTKGRELIRFGSRFAERVKRCRRGGGLSPRKWKSQGWASNSGNSWWVGIFLSPLPPKLQPKRPQMIPSFTLSPRKQLKQYLHSLKMVPLFIITNEGGHMLCRFMFFLLRQYWPDISQSNQVL